MPTDREHLKKALVARLTQRWGFPLKSAPYCDLAEEVGSTELEVLDAVLELRATGEVGRINAEFEGGPMGFCSEYDGEQMTLPPVAGIQFTCAEADLAMLAADNLPYGEHPYEELAAELSFRGIQADETWVLDRLHAWTDAGAIVRFGAEKGSAAS